MLRDVECSNHIRKMDFGSSDVIRETPGDTDASASAVGVILMQSDYNREKLMEETKGGLRNLTEFFEQLIEDKSEQLVELLQERHGLKEELHMRKVAIEQLVQFQSESLAGGQESVKMGIIAPRGLSV